MRFCWELLNEFKSAKPDAISIKTPDRGSNYTRKNSTKIRELVSSGILVDNRQRSLFRQFYFKSLQGSIHFEIYDCRIKEYREALFVGAYKENDNNGFFKITFNLSLGDTI